MTNFERLLDLPLREVLKEFGDKNTGSRLLRFSECMPYLVVCDGDSLPCKLCDYGAHGSCEETCKVWLEAEASPDANYNEDRWHDATVEDPPSSDLTIEYIVLIDGANQPTTLIFDGDSWRDHHGGYYRVALWRPMPKLPEAVI